MNELAEFLLARIAEDERWYTRDRAEEAATMKRQGYIATGGGWDRRPYRWQRGLAGCEAKRRILELHASGQPWCECGVWEETEHGEPGYEICPTLRLLALPYADHPDYRAEWRPRDEQR